MFIESNEWSAFPSPEMPFNYELTFYDVLLSLRNKFCELLKLKNKYVTKQNLIGRQIKVSSAKAESLLLLEKYKLRFCLNCESVFLFDSEKTLEKFNSHSIQW